jgi:hypothetical protein
MVGLKTAIRWPCLRLQSMIIVVGTISGLYVGSFFLMRQHVSASRGIPWNDHVFLGCPTRLHIYYFSSSASTNRILYHAYLPIHRWILQSHSDGDGVDFENDCTITSIYLSTEDKLRQVAD